MTTKSSSHAFANRYPNWIDLRPSLWFAGLLLLTHAILLAIIPPLSLPLLAKLFLSLGVIMSLAWSLRVHALRMVGSAVVRIWQEEGGDWMLMDKQGYTERGHLLGDSFVGQRLVILNFKMDTRRLMKPVVLFFDALAVQEFRRLRVYLLTTRKSIGD